MEGIGILDASLPSCSVCHIPIAKDQIHYGGKSCNSCRAFFRRNSLRPKLESCTKNQKCLISFIDRKSCASCRYEKCLRAGMRKEYISVTRKKQKQRKRSIEYDTEDNQPSPDDKKKIQSDNTEQVCVVNEMSETEKEEAEPIPHEIIADEVNESLIDPETGEIKDEEQHKFSIDKSEKEKSSQNTRDEMLIVNSRHEPELDSLNERKKYKSAIFIDSDSKDHLENYLHKKFNRSNLTDTIKTSNGAVADTNIKNVLIEKSESETNLNIVAVVKKQARKSVIVKRKSLNDGAEEPHVMDSFNLTIALTLPELENMYSVEEAHYRNNTVRLFDAKWNSLSLDSETLMQTLRYEEEGISENLPLAYFKTLNNYLRERLYRFIFSLPEVESLPMEKQYKLMLKNSDSIRLLFQVVSHSLDDTQQEANFFFSTGDRERLGPVSEAKTVMTIKQMTDWAPIPDVLRQEFIQKMNALSNIYVKDKDIFIMLLMIVLFHDDEDPEIWSVRSQIWNMLRRFIESKTDTLEPKSAMEYLENFTYSIVN